MSLTGMLRSSLGIQAAAPTQSHLTSELARKGGIVAGAAISGYVNGRFASPGQDHLEVTLPKWLGGQKIAADILYAGTVNLLALFDMVPFGLDEMGVNSADGVLGQVIGRMATVKGSEHKLAALTQAPANPQVTGASNVVDMRPRGARMAMYG
jgi:hypothetical protein